MPNIGGERVARGEGRWEVGGPFSVLILQSPVLWQVRAQRGRLSYLLLLLPSCARVPACLRPPRSILLHLQTYTHAQQRLVGRTHTHFT